MYHILYSVFFVVLKKKTAGNEKKIQFFNLKSLIFCYLCTRKSAQALCPDGGIGRRAGLKHQWGNPCRFDPGSGYEFNSTVIAKSIQTKDLAIFLFSNFPAFSPHLQVSVQSEPCFPHQKSTNLWNDLQIFSERREYCRKPINVFNRR